ncbi:MAG: 50S ribosomal protein L3 [Deltaproteobacteria bacterium]|nr:50S ribosomal protein L3 [Deltaproteobacteria bacterium]
MVQGILGKKLGMTRLFLEEGKSVTVTLVEAGPCPVLRINPETETQGATLQLGFQPIKKNRVNKPRAGYFKKQGQEPVRHLREFPATGAEAQVGDEVRVEMFTIGEKVKVSGVSKGKGFAGVVKRHGFAGGKATHGCTSHAVPGSIGSSAYPSRVIKGKKMPGHLGNHRVTVKNLAVVDIRPEFNLIILKGAVPGARNSLVAIYKQ